MGLWWMSLWWMSRGEAGGDEPVVEEPVVEEPTVVEPVVEEPTIVEPTVVEGVVVEPVAVQRRPGQTLVAVAPPVLPAVPQETPRRSWSLAAVGGTVVVLLLMTALTTLVVREVRRGGNDAGSLAGSVSYAAPVSVPDGSEYVRTTFLPDGRLRVSHWIATRHAQNELRIHLPDVTGLPSGGLSVAHLVLAADGLRVYAPESVPRRGLMLAVPPAHRIFVSYVLSGAVEASDHPAGRALARVLALDVSTGEPTTSSVTSVVGARVLALACSAPTRTALPQPCGEVHDGSWTVDLRAPHAQDRVLAQVDLR